MLWLPRGEKHFEDKLIIYVDRMCERDGHTDRHTLHDGIGRACKTTRGKNLKRKRNKAQCAWCMVRGELQKLKRSAVDVRQ